MDGFLRQATASQIRCVGPFIDDTDFKTAETGLTISNTSIKVSKNGATSVNKNSGGATHDVNGKYYLTWDATDTSAVGELSYSIAISGALIVWGCYTVLEETVYDALFAATAPGYLQPATAGRQLLVDASGFASLPTTQHTAIADATLNRDMALISDTTARSPLNALRFLRNKWSVSGVTLTVTKEDDTTPAWAGTLTAAPGADPISGNDPA